MPPVEQYELPHISHEEALKMLKEVDASDVTFSSWEAEFTDSVFKQQLTAARPYLTPKQRTIIFRIIRQYSDLLD